jgi:Fic family protein
MLNIDTIHVSQELLALLSEIDEFKGAWRALGTIAPDRLNALRRVATIESIGSSTRIEGSKLTDREVERLLSNLEIRRFSTRDEQEVAGYADVMKTVFLSWSDIPVTENHIKQLHRDLLRYSDKDERHRGEYKTLRNDVGAFDAEGKMIGIVFETATPFDTPQRMTELVAWLNEARELRRLHPLLIVAVFIVVFLAIHPFQDGNGRLSRVLTTLLLLQAGYVYVPYSSLESVIENSKEAYYLGLRQTQTTIRTDAPNWQPWLLFFMRAPAAPINRTCGISCGQSRFALMRSCARWTTGQSLPGSASCARSTAQPRPPSGAGLRRFRACSSISFGTATPKKILLRKSSAPPSNVEKARPWRSPRRMPGDCSTSPTR